MVLVNFLIFLYHTLSCWSVTLGLDSIRKKYHIHKNSSIEIKIPFLSRYIIVYSENNSVKHVLMKKEYDISFINKVFSVSHNNIYGISNLSTQQNLWNIVHTSLKNSIDLNKLIDIMNDKENLQLLTYKCNFTFNYGDYDNNPVSEYVINIWSQFCFGKSVNINEYKKIRNSIMITLKKIFYCQKTNYIPYIGYFCATFYSWIYKNQLNEINERIEKILENIEENTFLWNFKQQIMNIKDTELNELSTIKKKIILDNVLLSFLVYDFLNSFLQSAIMNITIKNSVADLSDSELNNKRFELFNESIKESFLFPFRIRDNKKTGDIILINLVDSNVLFSYGPRSCIGQMFTNKFFKEFCKIFSDFDFIKIDDLPILRSENSNIPYIISNNIIKINYSKDYLKKNLSFAEHKGLKKFYKVETIFEDICLYNYLILTISDIIKKIKTDFKIDYLVISEARGYLLSPVSIKTGIPLIISRKKGKLPGETVCVSYKKQYDDMETIEITKRDLTDKNIIILDDGIASGETTCAQDILIKSLGGKVISTIVCIKHSYVELKYTGTVHYIFDL